MKIGNDEIVVTGRPNHPDRHDVPHRSEFCIKCIHEAYCFQCSVPAPELLDTLEVLRNMVDRVCGDTIREPLRTAMVKADVVLSKLDPKAVRK